MVSRLGGRKKMKDKNSSKRCYTLPIGPQHPMFVEAENIEVSVDGETIVDAKINVGYLHRGIEEMMQRRNWIQNIYLSERICGICSGVHSCTYCQMAENLLGVEIPERAKHIRMIVLELERMHSHLLYLGMMGYEMGLDTVFHYTWKDREFVMEMLEQISGNRVNYAMPAIGGVRRDIPHSYVSGFLKKLDHIEKRAGYYDNVFSKDRSVLARTRGIGILTRGEAEKLSIVGPVARASGVAEDIRKTSPYLAYDSVGWDAVSLPEGDVMARNLVKARELRESIKILRQFLKSLPPGETKAKVPFAIPEGEAVARSEAPRGELVYYGRSVGSETPARIKIRTPTFANILALKPMLAGQQLADLPVIVASIDPCFSCTDRITLVDIDSGKKSAMSGQEFRRRVEKVG
jgi:NADH-quinone oxidoreductase subunit D